VELLQLDSQQGETLTAVVVKLSANSDTFLFLCFDQLATDVCERGFGDFPLGDVYKSDHCPDDLLCSPLQIRSVFNWETCSVRPPQRLVLRVDSFLSSCCSVNSALLYGERCPVRSEADPLGSPPQSQWDSR
jgi:hypothetical protein